MKTCIRCGTEIEHDKCMNIFCEKSLPQNKAQIKKSSIFRSWYYIRQGYSTYLVFMIAVTNLIITSYYLAIKDIPILQSIFPHISYFAIFVLGVGIPSSLLLGWVHYKKSNAQHHQIEIEIESSPLTPIILETFLISQKIFLKQELTSEDKRKIEFLNKRTEEYFRRIKI